MWALWGILSWMWVLEMGKGFLWDLFWAEHHVGFLYEDMISFFLFVHSIHIDWLFLGLIFRWHSLGFGSCEVLQTSTGFFRYLNFRIGFWGRRGFDFVGRYFLHVHCFFIIPCVSMSGGTPVGGGFMRQRHSQGYASSGDDLEDDACSRQTPSSPAMPRARTWTEVMENILWIASAVFIIYYGDRNSNFIYLLFHDDRIRRLPLYLGMLGVSLNILIFFYTSMFASGVKKFCEKWELSSPSALPFLTLLGLVSFCLFSFALWPIWSFLTLPLLFTLFMACIVASPYVMTGTLRPQTEVLRTD